MLQDLFGDFSCCDISEKAHFIDGTLRGTAKSPEHRWNQSLTEPGHFLTRPGRTAAAQVPELTLTQSRLPGDVMVNGSKRYKPNEVGAGNEDKREVEQRRGAQSPAAHRHRRHFNQRSSSFGSFHTESFFRELGTDYYRDVSLMRGENHSLLFYCDSV